MSPRRAFLSIVGIALCVVAGVLLSSSLAREESLPHFKDAEPNDALARRIAEAMTNEELLAQILMFGWAGEEPSPLVLSWVSDRTLGSIKVFGWNTDNTVKVAESIAILQKRALAGRFGIPLFVATDQEGGWIRHIKGLTTETPGNLAIGASGLPADAWSSGFYIARELAAIGINLNFAPTVDLYTDHDSTVIGTRSFGENAEAAGILGASFMAGSRAAGVLTTAKHFPGHGDTGLDSHGSLPVIHISRETLFTRELVPFKALISAGVPAIMTGHLSFPRAIGSPEPATFSHRLINGILREDLGFTGLVITDDIMMNGATAYAGSVSRAVELAIEAGNDIVESSTTPRASEAFWSNNLSRMATSPRFRERVAQSATRVIKAKLDYFKGPSHVPIIPDVEKIPSLVPDPEGAAFFLSQAVRSVTLIDGTLEPLTGDGEGMLIASSFPSFLAEGKNRYPRAKTAGVNNSLWRESRDADTIVFCLSGADQLPYLRQMAGAGKRLVIVSAHSPILLRDAPRASSALALYSYSPWSFKAAFAALRGDFVPTGTLPLKGLR